MSLVEADAADPGDQKVGAAGMAKSPAPPNSQYADVKFARKKFVPENTGDGFLHRLSVCEQTGGRLARNGYVYLVAQPNGDRGIRSIERAVLRFARVDPAVDGVEEEIGLVADADLRIGIAE